MKEIPENRLLVKVWGCVPKVWWNNLRVMVPTKWSSTILQINLPICVSLRCLELVRSFWYQFKRPVRSVESSGYIYMLCIYAVLDTYIYIFKIIDNIKYIYIYNIIKYILYIFLSERGGTQWWKGTVLPREEDGLSYFQIGPHNPRTRVWLVLAEWLHPWN